MEAAPQPKDGPHGVGREAASAMAGRATARVALTEIAGDGRTIDADPLGADPVVARGARGDDGSGSRSDQL